jgi:hypothetical protein
MSVIARVRRWVAWRELTGTSALELRRRRSVRVAIVRYVLGACLLIGLLAIRDLG